MVKVVVGLGNPGREYAQTPHNVGFDVVDALAAGLEGTLRGSLRLKAHTGEVRIGDTAVLLVKPDTFMNLSGEAVAAVLRRSPATVEDLIVVLDDADLPLGHLRVRAEGGSGGHRGLASVIASVGTQAFPRVRVGVGRGDGRRDLVAHVLARPAREDRILLAQTVGLAAKAVLACIRDGVPAAMNAYNGAQAQE